VDFKPNWLDRVLSFFSPIAGLRRLSARSALQLMSGRSYDGASQGRRTKGWRATSADADKEISVAAETLRNRSRDLVRNTPYATKAVHTIVSNVVGTGIMLKFPDSETLQQRFKDWAENPKSCDQYGSQDFYSLQALIFRTIVESGEVLILKRRHLDGIRLEVLEPDFLDLTKIDATGRIRDGIEYDEKNQVIGYWMWEQHPGSKFAYAKTTRKSVFIPASEVIHRFKKERPGQTRGVPWLAPAMIRLRDYDDYEDAQLQRQKIAACFVGFITDSEQPLTQSSTSEEEKKPISERFQPGAWEVLPPGKDIKFAVPPGVGTDYDPYVRRQLLSIAAALGISYEALTGDLSNVNFSSGRMGWIEFHRSIELWRWHTVIPTLDDVIAWWLEGESVGKSADLSKTKRTWTPPRREMIDPVKETEAMKNQVRSGFATISDSLRQMGLDPIEHFAEYEKDNKILDEKKLVLDSDPRVDLKLNNNTRSGGNSENQPTEEV
jgi:lambda family phage portal protein